MGQAKDIKKSEGITLVALVVTIIILIILASISINVTMNENGLISNAKRTKMATEMAQCKEEFDLKKLSLEVSGNMNIYDLKEQLEKQIKSLQVGQTNAGQAIEEAQFAEGSMTDLMDSLYRVHELAVLISNNTATETEKESIKVEINDSIAKINRIAGEIGTKNYVVEFGDGYFNQGNIEVRIEDVSFKKIYGADEINYTNIEEAEEKLNKAINNVVIARTNLGAVQNTLEHVIEYESMLQEKITNIYNYIFYDDVTNKIYSLEETAIKKAKSWGTTKRCIDIAKVSIDNIDRIMHNINDLAFKVEEEYYDQGSRQNVQIEINAKLSLIKNILTYAGVSDKKVFDGQFPYMQEVTLKSLEIENISVMSKDDAVKSHEKITKAIQKVENFNNQLSEKQEELATKENEMADQGYAFDVTHITVDIPEAYKDKLAVINGELTYIGNDKEEKKIAEGIGIKVEK